MAFRREKALANAAKYAAKGQHEKAVKEYQAIVDHDPKDVRSWLLLADCLVRVNRREDAVQKYLQVADFYAKERQSSKALAVYRQVLNLDATRLDVHVRCGALYQDLGQMPDAISTYERAAGAYLKSGNSKEALKLYSQVAELDESIAKRLRLAELYSREGMVDLAVDHFSISATYLREKGRPEEYVRVAERLLFHKVLPEVVRELVRVYLDLDQSRRALVKLNGLLQETPGDPEGLLLLSETFVRMGRFNKAVSVILELVRASKDEGDEGKATARNALQKGLQWVPDNPQMQSALDELGGASVRTPVPAPTVDTEAIDEAEAELEMDMDLDDAELEELDDAELEELDEAELEELDDAELEELDDEDLDDDPETLAAEVAAVSAGDAKAGTGGEASFDLEDGDFDMDKHLEEVRVLLKYQLFEHALDHSDQLMQVRADHPGVLELRSQLFVGLDRETEAAQTLVDLAEVLRDRDPGAAKGHLERALEIVPGFEPASVRLDSLGGGLEAGTPPSSGEDAVSSPDLASEFESGLGDSGSDDAFGSISLDEEEVEVSHELEDSEFDLDEDELAQEIPLEVDTGSFQTIDEEPTTPIEVEDRFGLDEDEDEEGVEEVDAPADAVYELDEPQAEPGVPQPVEESPASAVPSVVDDVSTKMAVPLADIADDISEVHFFVAQGLDDDAAAALDELETAHPGHPDLLALRQKIAGGGAADLPPTSQPAPDPSPEPVDEISSGIAMDLEEELGELSEDEEEVEASAPLLDLAEEDAEADDYLANIFGDDEGDDDDAPQTPAAKESSQARARAEVDGADASTHFDLGTAYREMGLVDDALREFETASEDPRWRARAQVMLANLELHRGEREKAVGYLESAIEAAQTGDERCEAHYELGLLYETLGDQGKAIAALESVDAGYRDVEERLESLRSA